MLIDSFRIGKRKPPNKRLFYWRNSCSFSKMQKMFYYTVLILSCTTLIIYKINTMSQAVLEQLKADAAKARQAVTNIRGDIQRLKDGLPNEGGLTAAEVEDLKADLASLAGEADTLDKENEETADSGAVG